MIQCPNCGQSVREDQRFCGNCGADVHAALAQSPNMVEDQSSSAYAYPQNAYSQSQSYGYQLPPDSEASSNSRRLMIAAVFIIAVCCALAFGCFVGFELPTMMGVPIGPTTAPTPRPSPTPASLNLAPFRILSEIAWLVLYF